MTSPQEIYDRAVRLGKIVPREIVKIKVVERPAGALIPRPVAPPPSNVIVAPIPVHRPYVVYRRWPMAEDILAVVAQFYDVTVNDILSARRQADVVKPRHVAFFLMKELTTLSFPRIARSAGRADHTTIMHGYNKILSLRGSDARLRDEIDILKIQISELMSIRNGALDRIMGATW